MAVPTESALWEAAGKAYEAGVDKSAAMQQYRLFVQTYGGSQRAASAQYMVGECYFAAEDYEGALREYAKVSDRKGRDDYLKASVLLRQGECNYNLGRFDKAIEHYDRLVKKYDDTFMLAEGLYEIGLAYIVEGNWLKLRAAYRELLERRPGYGEMPQVKFALGLFAYQEQNYDEAIANFEQVPSDRGLYYLGRCLEDTGQYILAIQRYRQVLRKYPGQPPRRRRGLQRGRGLLPLRPERRGRPKLPGLPRGLPRKPLRGQRPLQDGLRHLQRGQLRRIGARTRRDRARCSPAR